MTNIDHTNCTHESSSAARAKCRRSIKKGNTEAPKASTKSVDFKGSGGAKGTTPRDRWNACDICGVERATLKGTDPITNVLTYTGDKCSYILKQSDDITPLD